jgi:hypothetical protein
LPPVKYLPALLGLNPLVPRDRQTLDNHIGSIAQFRESFYISYWHLFRSETDTMWKEYGDDGVAICSRYCLLKSALDAMGDRAFLGLVRYGAKGRQDRSLRGSSSMSDVDPRYGAHFDLSLELGFAGDDQRVIEASTAFWACP